jgi:hypothetical protein
MTWSTTISTFFEYAQGGRFNYIYGGDINNDGSSTNDLIYVPTTTEIATMAFSGGPTQGEAFDRFISQDKYLSGRRGQYSERYGALSPWRGKWDNLCKIIILKFQVIKRIQSNLVLMC